MMDEVECSAEAGETLPGSFDDFPDEALPLVEVTEDGEAGWSLSVNEKTLALLSTIQERVCITTLVGRYRSGKSSLLNWLRDPENRGGGFEVGHGVSRCTKGIWVWGRPLSVTLDDGSSAALLLLDTEGLGGLGVDGSYDATIFSLSALLASTLCYNSLGALDERAILDVGFVARLSSSIRARPLAGDGDPFVDSSSERAALARQLPRFVWILRDFALDLEDEAGRAIDADAYLERALAPKGTSSQDSTRSALVAYFPERSCATLPRPYDSEAALRGGAAEGGPRAAFVGALDALRGRLIASAAPKAVEGVPLRGAAFAGLVAAYVRAFAEGATPTIATAWATLVRDELAAAVAEGAAAHERLMDAAAAGCDPDEGQLARHHVAACRAVEDGFRARCGALLSSRGVDFEAALGAAREACDARFEARSREGRSAARSKLDGALRAVNATVLDARVRATRAGRARDEDARETADFWGLEAPPPPRAEPYADDDAAEAAVAARVAAPDLAFLQMRCAAPDGALLAAAAVAASFAAARAVFEAREGSLEAAAAQRDDENGRLRARVAFLEAGSQALKDATEDAMRKRAASMGESAKSLARVAALEAEVETHSRNHAALATARDRACAELQDATQALANEEFWQMELQRRLDESLEAHKAKEAEHAQSRHDLQAKVVDLVADLEATRQALDKRTRPRGRVFPAGYHPTQTCMGATDADQDDVVLNGRARSIVDVEVVEKLEIDDAPPRGLVEV